MSRRPLRGVALIACAFVWTGMTAERAWARKASKPAPKEERLQEPEAPPPSFIAPPPGYEPPPQFQPGDATAAPRPAYEEPLPGFMTLDRVDASMRLGVQGGWHKIDDVALSDAFIVRVEPYGQFILPNRAGGLYGQLPMVHRFDFGADDASALGNLELGGFFLPNRSSELIIRGGIALPTGSESLARAGANAESRFERLTDFVLTGPSYTTLRLSGSTVQRWDVIFLRADVGFDFVLNKASIADNATSVFGRANVAVCARLSGVDFGFELVNLVAFNGTAVPSGLTNHLFHTAAISVRSPGEDQFHLGLIFPLDHESRGDAWIVSLGYQRAGWLWL
ncbi:MAG TPA: hypothetical protein VN903_30565 [Polyangia bacterium]|jgi:hypothetical protein|nr:hypothetical protein [Polyangia bacterium]